MAVTRPSERAEEMLRFDMEAENATVRHYRGILVQEQGHQIDLATALGKDVVDAAATEELV